MMLPTIAILALIVGYPVVSTFVLSTRDYNLLDLSPPSFIGLENFGSIWSDRVFWEALTNTLWYTFGTVVVSVLIGGGIALLLENLQGRFAGWIRAFVVAPWAVPFVVTAFLFRLMYMQNGGVVNEVLLEIGLIASPVAWLNDSDLALPSIIVANIWGTAPFFFLLVASALVAIPDSVLESARVDRAGLWSTFWHIKLPFLRNPLVIGSLLMIIMNFNDFAKVWVMTQGGPGYASTTLVVYVYRMAFENFELGYASALGVIWLLLLLVVAAGYIRLLWGKNP
ncbi:sugar ABC transporter permease [Aurantimonas sp. VKM B-3413]|nr:sugar ABC transporter permease [Aurantimonas sp. VKM B-3413]